MPPLNITDKQVDQILFIARTVLAETCPISTAKFHETVLVKEPSMAEIGADQIEFVLSTYYDFSSGEVVERDLGSHDRISTKAFT